MNLNQERVRKFLTQEMIPGKWYEVKELINLFESKYSEFTSMDKEPLPSEPKRPRWHRLVTNAPRMSPGREDYGDNSWVELRTRKLGHNREYSIAPKDIVEESILSQIRFDDDSGYVYAVINPAWPVWVKIGMTIDIHSRIDAYQTYSPCKDYQVANSVEVVNRRYSENIAHKWASDKATDTSGEWFKISLTEVADILARLE